MKPDEEGAELTAPKYMRLKYASLKERPRTQDLQSLDYDVRQGWEILFDASLGMVHLRHEKKRKDFSVPLESVRTVVFVPEDHPREDEPEPVTKKSKKTAKARPSASASG